MAQPAKPADAATPPAPSRVTNEVTNVVRYVLNDQGDMTVESVKVQIADGIAYPLDGGAPMKHGPGIAGCWATTATEKPKPA